MPVNTETQGQRGEPTHPGSAGHQSIPMARVVLITSKILGQIPIETTSKSSLIPLKPI